MKHALMILFASALMACGQAQYAFTNFAGCNLQSTTNLVSPAFWPTVSPGPVVINVQNVLIASHSSFTG